MVGKSLVKNPFNRKASDAAADTLHTTPWSWKDDSGLYVGSNSEVWLYRTVPCTPMYSLAEDQTPILNAGQNFSNLLIELGESSREGMPGISTHTKNYREIHIASITWYQPFQAYEGANPKLATYIDDASRAINGFPLDYPVKSLFIGVKLRTELLSAKSGGLLNSLKEAATKTLGEGVPNIERYATDRTMITTLLSRAGCSIPTNAEYAQLESWYNLGRGPDALVVEHRDHIVVKEDDEYRIELAALNEFRFPVSHAPNNLWAMAAEITNPGDAAFHINIRAELEPPTAARKRSRQSQRKIKSQMDEEMRTGDLERPEMSDTFQLASAVEDHFIGTREPLLTNCSIIMSRRDTGAATSYTDDLKNVEEIIIRPLTMRQLPALDETLPCSSRRVNPFLQELSISMVAYSGLNGFSGLGDSRGVFVGLSLPNYTPTYLDPLLAPAMNKPPSMAIFGDPGSGKTFLAQSIAYQASLAKLPVIFINPKGFDSLSPFADIAGGTVVSMSSLESASGAFDPFRFAENPEIAAQILTDHILSVLVEFTEAQELTLANGLMRAAKAGARCAADALRSIQDVTIVELILKQVAASTLFSLGFGRTPQAPFSVDSPLTLIEFDRKLALPDTGKSVREYSREERIALSAIRLVTRASMEILARTGGGVLIVDEAWTFLSHREGLAALQQLGREGRSLNVFPIFCTQKIADILSADMESYLSRIFVMALQEEKEAAAALSLCGLKATPARLNWLRQAGPRAKSGEQPAQVAQALHKDLQNKHSAVWLGPTPEYAREAFTTNPAERESIRERLANQSGDR